MPELPAGTGFPFCHRKRLRPSQLACDGKGSWLTARRQLGHRDDGPVEG
jgi:hypothetical protein